MSLPEYESNPYIAGLPPIEGPQQIFGTLSRPPSWEEANLQLAPVIRRHCVQRLKRYFRPGPRHVLFAEEFGMMLRNGYLGRDPSDGRHEATSLLVAEQARSGVLLSGLAVNTVDGEADCGVLVGTPGMGKTRTVKEVLRTYPQLIEHPGLPPQITHLRLDTPAKGSLRGLCVSFFGKLDELLGQNSYSRLFAGQHATEESMLHSMALIARFHGLGCLIIDEIQHLPRGGEEDHALLTFLVTMANTMGVPVMFIGTMKALKLFERTARMARRSVGNFGGPWERYEPTDDDWKDFLNDLWQYRWTTNESLLTPELRSVIYNETQGVVDLAVKLMMRVQMRLILRTEMHPKIPEEIDASFIRKIAEIDFKPVRGFVDALRSGDSDRINAYEDLSDFHRAFEKGSEELASPPKVSISTPMRRDDDYGHEETIAFAPEQAVRDDLRRRGFERDVIDAAIDQAKVDMGEEEPGLMALLSRVEKLLKKPRKTGAKPAVVVANLVEGDLRGIARGAVDRTVHEALTALGLSGDAALRLVA